MLQQLPDTHQLHVNEIERIFMLANTLTAHELLNDGLERIITKLFNEDNVVVMPKHPVIFACSCSRQRVSEILRNLGKDELTTLINEQGIFLWIVICNTEYRFTEYELSQFILQLSIEDLAPISTQIN